MKYILKTLYFQVKKKQKKKRNKREVLVKKKEIRSAQNKINFKFI
jgi:hypothetical protein